MKCIHKELKTSLDHCYLILNSEKKVFTKEKIQQNLKKKYTAQSTIKDFFLGYDYYLQARFSKNPTDNEYMRLFRNFAMHYHLQDPKRKKEIEKKLLKIVK